MTGERVVLIGESNPYSDDPYFALYPKPEGASGHRLCVILGMTAGEYLAAFDRLDLLPSGASWRIREARVFAADVKHARRVLLGAKVAAAFGCAFKPFTLVERNGWRGVILPHPSGRNAHRWTPDAISAARRLVNALRSAPPPDEGAGVVDAGASERSTARGAGEDGG